MDVNAVSGTIVDAAVQVHSALGPGLLESAYEAYLACELRRRGLEVLQQMALPLVYEGLKLEVGYRLDMLVQHAVVVEIKTAEAIHPIYKAQLLSYLKLSGKRVGLLLNFHLLRMRDGIVRMVNRH